MNKVCFFNLSTYSSIGGIEKYNQNLLKALDFLNIKTTSLSVYDKVNIEEFNNIEFKNFNKNKLKSSVYLLKNIYKIEELVVSHINLMPIVIVSKILNPKLNIYIAIYGVEVWKNFSALYRFFFKKISFLSISSYTTDVFIEFNALKKNNIHYLPPSVNLDLSSNIKNPYDNKNFNILSLSRLHEADSYKGIDSMIKTIPLLLNRIPNIKFTIVGSGNDKERLMQLSQEMGVENYIDFKGFVKGTESYYKYCDMFCLPSKGEGFGIVYLEAMKYKRPCIACNEGGQTDVVINKKTGFLCDYDDLHCLVENIIRLSENPQKVQELGDNGYQYLLNNFTFDKFQSRLRSILKK